jgi:uncharacterized membrane protein YvbJ
MYCNKCGARIAEGSSFCSQCGAAVDQPAEQPQPENTQPQTEQALATEQTSGFAVASLVLGIVGIIINFLSVLAIIFGAIGISQTSNNPALKGKGMAVAGLVLGIIVVFLWIILIFLIGSFFWWA